MIKLRDVLKEFISQKLSIETKDRIRGKKQAPAIEIDIEDAKQRETLYGGAALQEVTCRLEIWASSQDELESIFERIENLFKNEIPQKEEIVDVYFDESLDLSGVEEITKGYFRAAFTLKVLRWLS